jgi:hypothetical protein
MSALDIGESEDDEVEKKREDEEDNQLKDCLLVYTYM